MKISLALLPFVAIIATVFTGIYAAKMHSDWLCVLCFFLFLVTLVSVNNLAVFYKKNQ
jgi:hypothetical protein